MTVTLSIHRGEEVISTPCLPGQTVLAAASRARYMAIVEGCRGGGCGVCRIQILSGRARFRKMSRAQVSEADQAAGIVLACCVYPETDMAVRPLPRQSL
jgi:ferredoxin